MSQAQPRIGLCRGRVLLKFDPSIRVLASAVRLYAQPRARRDAFVRLFCQSRVDVEQLAVTRAYTKYRTGV